VKQPPRAFPYYGSKARIAKYYPTPEHGTIIEPFAGAAAYSQRYWKHNIILCDVNPRVVACWKFLIAATKRDILALPKVKPGMELHTLGLSEGEHALLEFHNYDGFAHVRDTKVGKRAIWNRYQERLANLVHHFDHWKVFQVSFEKLPNDHATWFIDPPYMFGGEHYDFGTDGFSFASVARFARSRMGQVIVCENTKANWLPFRPLVEIKGCTNKTSVEAIWTQP